MIESAPSLLKANEQAALRLLTTPQYKDLFTKIDNDYLYWDKVKYLVPEDVKPRLYGMQ